KCGLVVGSSSVSAASITDESGSLTIGAATISSPNFTVPITASKTGDYPLIVSATLANGEIYKGLVDLKVIEPNPSTRDYEG
ncbi:MAG TPA: hypothetical protein VFS91_04165, partial [Nitrobacter sp.]|nr:hypothetical protein [Nitrobacter sp.]